MADITDVPYLDVRGFILANNKIIPDNKKSAYDLAFSLLKNIKSKGRTLDLVLWSFAHNLLANGVHVNVYTESEINRMSSAEINKLSKSLTMKNNNIGHIKAILGYLHKLENNAELDPDVKDEILDFYGLLKISDINDYSDYDDLILLLKTHHNKNLVRMKINEYLDFIMDLHIVDPESPYDPSRTFNDTSKNWHDPRRDSTPKFVYDLIKLKEIGLAKRAIAVMNEYEKYYDGSPPMLKNLFKYAEEDPLSFNRLLGLKDFINDVYGYDIVSFL